MPIYEFKCNKCGTKFEELINSGYKNGNIECPECGSKESERLFSCFSSSISGNSSSSQCGQKSGFS